MTIEGMAEEMEKRGATVSCYLIYREGREVANLRSLPSKGCVSLGFIYGHRRDR